MIGVADFDDLTKNAEVRWKQAAGEFPSVRQQLAVIKTVSEKTSEYSDISGMTTAKRRNDGDDAIKSEPKQGYTKTFNQQEIALNADVTKQMRMFDKYDEIMKRMRGMASATERRIELDIASLLSYAWSSSYTNMDGETVTTSTPDGQTLISASHVPNGSSTTWSNQLPTTNLPISPSVLEDMEELANGFLDDGDGRNIPIMMDTIITGRHAPTIHEVRRILGSQLQPQTANNAVNTMNGAYRHLVVPFLDLSATENRTSSKKQYVFLANLGNQDQNGFKIEFSQDVRFEAPEQVFESSIWQYLTTALYDFGTLRANFIVGTKGDSSSV